MRWLAHVIPELSVRFHYSPRALAKFDQQGLYVEMIVAEGMAEGLSSIENGVTVHLACHARAQNIGPKAADMLRLIPDTPVSVIERCSGHGGSWGMMKENFDTALKVGRPASRQALEANHGAVVSECPLAAIHILQGMEEIEAGKTETDENQPQTPDVAPHPIEIIAKAYGL